MRRCVNCGDPRKVCLLCGSCWRLTIVAPAVVEAVHRIAAWLFT